MAQDSSEQEGWTATGGLVVLQEETGGVGKSDQGKGKPTDVKQHRRPSVDALCVIEFFLSEI